jgi:hypothetical protein
MESEQQSRADHLDALPKRELRLLDLALAEEGAAQEVVDARLVLLRLLDDLLAALLRSLGVFDLRRSNKPAHMLSTIRYMRDSLMLSLSLSLSHTHTHTHTRTLLRGRYRRLCGVQGGGAPLRQGIRQRRNSAVP